MQAAHRNSPSRSESERLRLLAMAAAIAERIGERIRDRRDELGYTRRRVVALMEGVATENDLYRWEKGKHRSGDDNLAAVARALDVDPAYFLMEHPHGAVSPSGSEPARSVHDLVVLAERVEQIATAVEKLLDAQQVIAQMAEEDRALLREVAQAVRLRTRAQ